MDVGTVTDHRKEFGEDGTSDFQNEKEQTRIEWIRLQCQKGNDRCYLRINWLPQNDPTSADDEIPKDDDTKDNCFVVDKYCRSVTLIWMHQIITVLEMQISTCEYAINYLDRFMGSGRIRQHATNDQQIFQLVAITCLYIAIKIHEPIVIDSNQIVLAMSNDSKWITVQQVERMERLILSTLQWKLHPPTTQQFIHDFLDVIQISFHNEIQLIHIIVPQQNRVIEMAAQGCMHTLTDSEYITTHVSVIAYASIMASLHYLVSLEKELKGRIRSFLLRLINESPDDLLHPVKCDLNRLEQQIVFHLALNFTISYPPSQQNKEVCDERDIFKKISLESEIIDEIIAENGNTTHSSNDNDATIDHIQMKVSSTRVSSDEFTVGESPRGILLLS